eukprot:3496982-Pyramimonas_sp.AAC.1
MVFIPKGEEQRDFQTKCFRKTAGLRPLGLNGTDNKIIAAVVFFQISKIMPSFAAEMQGGFIRSRYFGNDIAELD